MLAQVTGQTRRRAHQIGDQAEQAGIGSEQREQLDAGRQVGDELVEPLEGRVGIGLLGDRVQQPRHQLGQQLARPSVAGRADVAVVPGAHARRNGARMDEPHLGQSRQRVRIIVGAGEDQGAPAAQIDAAFEQGGVVLSRPARSRLADRVGERVGVRIAHEGGEALQLLGASGQAVGLPVGDHLKAVLGPAQEAVGLDQLVRGGAFQPAGLDQGAQRRAGAGRPQLGEAAAEDQLLGLDEELDLADAAAADLEIVAGDPDLAVTPIGVDLALDRVDVADRRIVQVPAPEKRLERPQEAAPRRRGRRR